MMELENKAGMPVSKSCEFFPGQQIDTFSIHADIPCIGLVERSQDVQQRTFSRTG